MLMQSLPTTDLQPATEVSDRPRRRTYTADYKRRIVREADAAKEVGAISALLRREGLFSSTLSEWRRAHDNGDLGGGTKPRGPAPKPGPDARDGRIAELEREVAKMEWRARRAEAMVELQKKVSLLLDLVPITAPTGTT